MRSSALLIHLTFLAISHAHGKALPFGRSTPMVILEPQKYNTEQSATYDGTVASHSQPLSLHIHHSKEKTLELHMREVVGDNKTQDEFHAEMEDDDDDDLLFSPNDALKPSMFTEEKRTTTDCGIYRMDCALARSGCNNACYYQNCVMQGNTVRYVDGGGKRFPKQASENRVDAGTTTNPSSPCRIMPLSQKTFDQWPNWKQDDPRLEMDEWPVAAMSQPEFSTLSPGTVRNSLRCIHHADNSKAGNLYKFFRRGIANYNQAQGGKYAHLRTCGGSKAFRGGETFRVDFDLSGLTNTQIDEIVPYCKPNPDCTNDGQQLHLSDLNYVTPEGKAGRMGWPYDLETMNNYKITGESYPVESFQVVVSITADDRDVYEAVVSKFRNNALEQVGTASIDEFRLDQSMTVTGLPRDLIITRRSDASGERLDFVYGDPTRELAGFAFNTNDSGYSYQFDEESDGTDGYKYCLLEDIKDPDGDTYGQRYVCWFAGW